MEDRFGEYVASLNKAFIIIIIIIIIIIKVLPLRPT
jgi:hypothetical protein